MTSQPQLNVTGTRAALCVLLVTAAIFLVGVMNRSAMATGQTDRGGDYVMLGMMHRRGLEHVVIMDAASRRMAAYALNRTTHRLDKWTQFELGRLAEMRPAGADRRTYRRSR